MSHRDRANIGTNRYSIVDDVVTYLNDEKDPFTSQDIDNALMPVKAWLEKKNQTLSSWRAAALLGLSLFGFLSLLAALYDHWATYVALVVVCLSGLGYWYLSRYYHRLVGVAQAGETPPAVFVLAEQSVAGRIVVRLREPQFRLVGASGDTFFFPRFKSALDCVWLTNDDVTKEIKLALCGRSAGQSIRLVTPLSTVAVGSDSADQSLNEIIVDDANPKASTQVKRKVNSESVPASEIASDSKAKRSIVMEDHWLSKVHDERLRSFKAYLPPDKEWMAIVFDVAVPLAQKSPTWTATMFKKILFERLHKDKRWADLPSAKRVSEDVIGRLISPSANNKTYGPVVRYFSQPGCSHPFASPTDRQEPELPWG